MKPYKHQDQILVDISQIIPLPEAENYLVKIREQNEEKRKVQGKRQELIRKFWSQFIEESKKTDAQLFSGRSPTTDHWLSAGIGKAGTNITCSLKEDSSRAELWIHLGKTKVSTNKAWFDALHKNKEQIEKEFESPLDWQRLDSGSGCRICIELPGGWSSAESDWAGIQEKLLNSADKLAKVFSSRLKPLKDE